MPKASRQVGEATQSLEEGQHATVAEAQGWTTVAVPDSGTLKPLEGGVGEQTVVAECFGVEQTLVDRLADRAQVRQVAQAFVGEDIPRIVDRRLRAQGPLLLEVLLDVGALELDMQGGLDALGEDAGAVAAA